MSGDLLGLEIARGYNHGMKEGWKLYRMVFAEYEKDGFRLVISILWYYDIKTLKYYTSMI